MRQEHQALLALFHVLGRPWTMRVLWELRHGPLTYRAIVEKIDGLSSSVLTERLRTLGQEGLIEKAVGGYVLTPAALTLLPVMVQLDEAAEAWFRKRPR